MERAWLKRARKRAVIVTERNGKAKRAHPDAMNAIAMRAAIRGDG